MRIHLAAAVGGLVLAGMPFTSQASLNLNIAGPAGAVGENFNGFQGNAGTVPANFTVGGTQSGGYQGFFTDGSSAYSTVNGIYAGTQTSNTADNAFTARVPVSNTLTLTFAVTNNTGASLSNLQFSFNVEQYQDATATPNNINFLSDNGTGGAFDQNNITGSGKSVLEFSAGGTSTVYTTPTTVSETASYNQTIANGATVQFQWSWIPGGGGNRPIWGVDDLSVSGTAAPVPEPASAALLSLGGLGLLGRRARRARAVNPA
jgi:hypothetical protein